MDTFATDAVGPVRAFALAILGATVLACGATSSEDGTAGTGPKPAEAATKEDPTVPAKANPPPTGGAAEGSSGSSGTPGGRTRPRSA
jgi:hypothetical protein